MTIRASVSDDEALTIKAKFNIENEIWKRGKLIGYKSGQLENKTGINISVLNNKLKVSLSLHKYWNREHEKLGKRNDTLFTISTARQAFDLLCFDIGIMEYDRITIDNYEIGLNMQVSYTPLSFIELIRGMGGKQKIMFIDANYRPNRQKTTEKYDSIRKVYKAYDKGFEMLAREIGSTKASQAQTEPILRVETVQRRVSKKASKFFMDDNIKGILKQFYVDWKQPIFFRKILVDFNRRKSEVERAKECFQKGVDVVLKEKHEAYKAKEITREEYRTWQRFCDRFVNDNKKNIREEISEQEKEYKMLFFRVFDMAKR